MDWKTINVMFFGELKNMRSKDSCSHQILCWMHTCEEHNCWNENNSLLLLKEFVAFSKCTSSGESALALAKLLARVSVVNRTLTMTWLFQSCLQFQGKTKYTPTINIKSTSAKNYQCKKSTLDQYLRKQICVPVGGKKQYT